MALFYSVKKYHSDFEFFILTFDDQSYQYLASLKEENLRLISLETYNSFLIPQLKGSLTKSNISFQRHQIFVNIYSTIIRISIFFLYLDADVYLFNSLKPLYDEFGDSSIGITEHRVNKLLKVFVKHYGHYVIGVNLFRRSEDGLKCLSEWKNECESWYSGKPGYPLNFFPTRYFLIHGWKNIAVSELSKI